MRRKSGFSACGVGRHADLRDASEHAAEHAAAATGSTVISIVAIEMCISPLRPAALVAAAGREMSARIARKLAAPACAICGAVRLTASSPATSTSEPLRSALRATWPFSRARWRCFGCRLLCALVPCHGPIATCSAPSAATRCRELAGDPVGDERQRGADDEHRHRDLGREADGEHVQLRHDPRDDAERDVGDQQRDEHRRADLERGREHASRTPARRRRRASQASAAPSTGRVRRCGRAPASSRRRRR